MASFIEVSGGFLIITNTRLWFVKKVEMQQNYSNNIIEVEIRFLCFIWNKSTFHILINVGGKFIERIIKCKLNIKLVFRKIYCRSYDFIIWLNGNKLTELEPCYAAYK